ncbi:hypothetical protein ACFQJC_09890 [Haloferax namakaokahaiae]|uniref:Uncharacterized protein n=1 Tax=Haloferax namakaokahaiae TaxID=1748331 RepID=A0ABD5ZG19_9EURY
MYDRDSFNVVYLRDDVADEYTEQGFEDAVDDSRMESLMRPVYQNLLSEDHGELVCITKCFTGVTEMNFVVSDGVGTIVSLDSDALLETDGLVAEAQQILLDEQDE